MKFANIVVIKLSKTICYTSTGIMCLNHALKFKMIPDAFCPFGLLEKLFGAPLMFLFHKIFKMCGIWNLTVAQMGIQIKK